METELIKVTEYCIQQHAERDFIEALEQSGLIRLVLSGDERFIHYDQLPNLECFVSWHYDLDINLEGIEALFHMRQKMQDMKRYAHELEIRLKRYE